MGLGFLGVLLFLSILPHLISEMDDPPSSLQKKKLYPIFLD